MNSAKRLHRTFQASDGRIKLATLSSIGVLATVLVLALAVLPAGAGSGGPSAAGVQPAEISYGGGSGACSTTVSGRLPSAAANELHINNPYTGTFTQNGVSVALTVYSGDKLFDFEFLTPGFAAFDVVVNGGRKNTHYDYDNGPGISTGDQELHAPTKGNSLYSLSHINICFDEIPEADLSVAKTVDDETPNEGDTLTYTITAANSGPGSASGVSVADTLPPGTEVVAGSASPSVGVFSETTGIWSIGSLANGANATLTFQVTVDAGTAGQDLVNSVAISGTETDPGSGNNAASATSTVNSVDLSVTKVPRDPTPDVGDPVIFDITVVNLSTTNTTATGVAVVDTLPPGMTVVDGTGSETTPGGVPGTSGGFDTYTWSNQTVPPGTTVFVLEVALDPGTSGQELINNVSVSGNETDPTPDANGAASVPPVEVNGTLSGRKFHDHDTDGLEDPSRESGLTGWIVTAFPAEGPGTSADPTDSFGDYTITGLSPGTYTVCEQTNNGFLPTNGFGYTWAWAQSSMQLSVYPGYGADCTGYPGYEPVGYTVTVDGDETGVDFGNHRQVSLVCDPVNPVSVTLGGTNGDPLSTVTLPAGCTSGPGDPFVSSFDLGRSEDADLWDQFVVFGGDPQCPTIVEQLIQWDPEDATYMTGSGSSCTPGDAGCSLLVPTTLVRLTPGGSLQPVVFCSTLGGDPTEAVPDCLDSRSIAEGGGLAEGKIQVTETYRFRGDPPRFR